MKKAHFSLPVIAAIMAAILFAVSTPFAKFLVKDAHPVLLGGLLYLGWKMTGLMVNE